MNSEARTLPISIIIPTYNGLPWLVPCLQSIRQQEAQPAEIIVVDNSSSDGTLDWLSEQEPGIKLIRFEYNTGFAFAVNHGIKIAGHPLILLLNNDTLMTPGFLSNMTRALLDSPADIGGVNPLVVLHDSGKTDNLGLCLDKQWKAHQIGFGRAAVPPPYASPVEIFGANAGGSLFRKSFFTDTGLFDERFFAYYEDVDMAIRGRQKGWRFVGRPDITLVHRHSMTGNRNPAFKSFLLRRNYLYYLTKHAPGRTLLRRTLYLIFKDLGNLVHYMRNKANRDTGWGMLKAYREWLSAFGELRRERRPVHDASLLSWLSQPIGRGRNTQSSCQHGP